MVFVSVDSEALTTPLEGCLTQPTNSTVLVRQTLPVETITCVMVARANTYEYLWHHSLANQLPHHVIRRVAHGERGGTSSTPQSGGVAMPLINAPTGYPFARTVCPSCSTQLATGFLVCPQCGARFLYSETGPTPTVVPTPGGWQPLLEARKNVYGVSETQSNTGKLYNLCNKLHKLRR